MLTKDRKKWERYNDLKSSEDAYFNMRNSTKLIDLLNVYFSG